MMVFERVTSLQIIRSMCKRLVFVAMFLLLFVFSTHIHPIYAVDADCEPNLIEGLRTECQAFADPATGQIIPGTEYFKCADNIECDPDVNGNNTRRCCVVPASGSYGGNCKDPGTITRNELGTDSGGPNSIFNLKPKTCNVDEDATSPAGEDIFLVPPIPPVNPGDDPKEQSLVDYMTTHHAMPPKDVSLLGKPIIEESIQVETRPVFGGPVKQTVTWLYALDDDGLTRRYFYKINVGQGLHYYIADVALVGGLANAYSIVPKEVRLPSGGSGPLKNLGCKIGNAFLTPLYNGIASLNRLVTNQNNLPDITLLCNNGTPQFLDPGALTFNADGSISGLDPDKCKCVDVNSGPGTAAVLLCTRFIAGIEDGNTGGAQWRALLPAPDENGNGSQRFAKLLFGGITETTTVDEFQQGIKTEIDGFFNSDEVRYWADNLKRISSNVYIPEIFMVRFFGVHSIPSNPPPITNAELDTFKKNPFVRQYIGCLSCALYGGYPSALGCMPMDKVERFLAEGVLGVGITFAGAFSVLCIIFGAIQFQLSGGESAKVQKAQKLITQCVVGLLIILFSIFLLRFVGVNLLRIYGLS